MSIPQNKQAVRGDGNIFSQTGDVTVNNVTNTFAGATATDRPGLLILLERVRRFWVDEYLTNSLGRHPPLALSRTVLPDAIDHPWENVVEVPDSERHIVPADQGIDDVFADAGNSLLLLGAPGSGKTICLLELARALLDQAELNPALPIPVVLNLSSWSGRHHSLQEWAVEELAAKYFVARRIGARWLQENRLCLLLDGLDEVRADAQARCVGQINEFVSTVGVPGLVVCCRLAEYRSLPARLKAGGAVCLEALTSDQIADYLARYGADLSGLQAALAEDADLRTLAQSPLMLSLLCVAYADRPAEALRADGATPLPERRAQIFATFVARMFARKGKMPTPFSPDQTRRWLMWLARGLGRHGQSVFLLEQLQPDWLATAGERRAYVCGTRLLAGLVYGLGLGLMMLWFQPSGHGVRLGLLHGPGRDLAAGPLLGLCFGAILALMDAQGDPTAVAEQARPWDWRSVASVLACGAAGLGLGLVFGSLNRLASVEDGMIAGGVFAVFFAIRRARQGFGDRIQTVERLRWSWPRARSSTRRWRRWGGVLGGVVGLLTGAAVAVPLAPRLLAQALHGHSGRETALSRALDHVLAPHAHAVFAVGVAVLLFVGLYVLVDAVVIGLTAGLISLIVGGLEGGILETKTVPNQGLRLSFQNAFYAALFSGLTVTLAEAAFGLLTRRGAAPTGANLAAALNGLVDLGVLVGVPVWLWYGGLNVIQHSVLRLVLWRQGDTPRDYVRFLDHAARLFFLQKVGGGYVFSHRLLMDYFAGLDETAPSAPGAKKQPAG